jgi:quercetin dioxygenase-like cupin family protein
MHLPFRARAFTGGMPRRYERMPEVRNSKHSSIQDQQRGSSVYRFSLDRTQVTRRSVVPNRPKATAIVHSKAPVVPSPSGLPTRPIVAGEIGARRLFVAEQALAPGQAVPMHTHPVEEVLTFLDGIGEATCGADLFQVATGVSLFIPPEIVHGFRNIGTVPLRVLVIFPGNSFAQTVATQEP